MFYILTKVQNSVGKILSILYIKPELITKLFHVTKYRAEKFEEF